MFITLHIKKAALIAAIAVAAAAVCLSFFMHRLKSGDWEVFLADSAPAVLVIDAGHGGEDGGAVSASGEKESAFNLAIALRMQALAHMFGTKTAMTRSTEEIVYPKDADTTAKRKRADQKERIALINSVQDGILISVHQNKYPSSKPRGPQVLYAETDGSEDFGAITQEIITEALYPENKRAAAEIEDSIYLMKNVKCPAILVECGFLSNAAEEKLLKTDEYRLKIAAALYSSYVRYVNKD